MNWTLLLIIHVVISITALILSKKQIKREKSQVNKISQDILQGLVVAFSIMPIINILLLFWVFNAYIESFSGKFWCGHGFHSWGNHSMFESKTCTRCWKVKNQKNYLFLISMIIVFLAVVAVFIYTSQLLVNLKIK